VKGAELGAEDLGIAEGDKEADTAEFFAAAPLPETGVGPADRVAGIEEDDAVRDIFEDPLCSHRGNERAVRRYEAPGEDHAGDPGTAADPGYGRCQGVDHLARDTRREGLDFPGNERGRGGFVQGRASERIACGGGDRGPFRIADNEIAG
jgi:hypothetical protein